MKSLIQVDHINQAETRFPALCEITELWQSLPKHEEIMNKTLQPSKL
ncbi:MAG: hypothetical protein ACXW4B_10455 [Micavibrio sp.]